MNPSTSIAIMAANNASIAAMNSGSYGTPQDEPMPLIIGLTLGIVLLGMAIGCFCFSISAFKDSKDDIINLGFGVILITFAFGLLVGSIACFVAPFCG